MEEKLKGFKTYRHADNPKEEALHDEFVHRFGSDRNLRNMIFADKSDYLSHREKRIVVTTIQWLGSPSGQRFLRNLGYCEEDEFIPRETLFSSKIACLEQQLAKIPKWIKAIFR